MRFHFGVSFRWSSIKRFILPFLIGAIAYFGLPYLGLTIVHANSTTTYYKFSVPDEDLSNRQLYSDVTYQDVIDFIVANRSTAQYNATIFVPSSSYTSAAANFYIFLYPKNTTISAYFFILGNNFRSRVIYGSSGNYLFQVKTGTTTNASTFNLAYSNMKDCYLTANCSNTSITGGIPALWYTPSNLPINEENIYGTDYINPVDDNTNYDINSMQIQMYRGYFYYSTEDVILTNSNDSNFNSKYIIVNNNSINIGEPIKTTFDIFNPQPEPEPEPEPEEPSDINVPFSKYVFWFGDNDSEIEVLQNIYCLLVFYFSFIVFMKILNTIKYTRW